MPRKRHPVWENFKCITNKNTGRWAICKTCKKGMQGIPYRLARHRQNCEVKSNVENEECKRFDHSQENLGENINNLQPEREVEIKVEDSRVDEIYPHDKQQNSKMVADPFLVQSSKDRDLSKRTPEQQIVIKLENNSEDETPPDLTISNSNKQQKLDDYPPLLTAQEVDNNLPLLPIQEADNNPPLLSVQKANDNPPLLAVQEVDDNYPVLVVQEISDEQQELDSRPVLAAQKVNAYRPVLAAVQSPDDCDPFKKRAKLTEDPPQSRPRSYGKNDDCDLFGGYISGKMKQFDHKTRCVVQYLMSNILFQADMGTFREGNFDCQNLIGFHASNKNSKSNVNECNQKQ